MTARELVSKLVAAGWVEARQSGSHRIFKHPNFPYNLSVPDHGKKDLPTGTLQKLLKQAGLK